MIKTYIRMELSSEGESPKQIIERMKKIGAAPVVGDYDFELSLDEDERLFDKLEEIHHILRGSSVRYTVTTRTAVEPETEQTRPPATRYVDQKPVELKKTLYKAKLERWKEMGLDVSELEALLERDLDSFKEKSKEFLKTHLDHLSVIKDKHPPEYRVDGHILALLDEDGKTLAQLGAETGYSEEQILLALGRLMSSDSVRRTLRSDSTELYCLIPPPAPPGRQIRKVKKSQKS